MEVKRIDSESIVRTPVPRPRQTRQLKEVPPPIKPRLISRPTERKLVDESRPAIEQENEEYEEIDQIDVSGRPAGWKKKFRRNFVQLWISRREKVERILVIRGSLFCLK